MTRYYFDLMDSDGIVTDDEGMELPSMQRVQEEAARSLAGMARDAVVRRDGKATHHDEEAAGNSPWLRALAELRQRATREGNCYQHVQAITVAIDQYAEKALGNRDFFLNKPYGVD